jgi:2-amino-4-hydroxy-6-hydroxymethyldihydropteridine diphosphokinase
MSRVVLSIGSNLGDRLARLQAVVDGLGDSVRSVSPVYETDAWGGVSQGPFLNAVVIADDDGVDAYGWLRRAQALEIDNERIRTQKWGPRTLDVDLVCCFDGHQSESEVVSVDPELTLPHPFAHERAFVLLPWLAVDPGAELTVAGQRRPVRELLDQLESAERDGVRPTALTLMLSPDSRL